MEIQTIQPLDLKIYEKKDEKGFGVCGCFLQRSFDTDILQKIVNFYILIWTMC